MSCRYRTNSTVTHIIDTLKSDSVTSVKSSTPKLRTMSVTKLSMSPSSLTSLSPSAGANFITSFCNSKEMCFGNMVGDLMSAGISQSVITDFGSDFASAVACSLNVDSLLNLLDNVLESIEDLIATIVNSARQLLQKVLEAVKFDSYQVFNAKRSLSVPNPTPSNTNGTNVPTVKKADYSLKDSYPKSYGTIDEAKNWTKVNTETGHSETVHNSGAQEKIDKKGNIIRGTPGSVQEVVDGDKLVEVKGNLGLVVGGNFTITVNGNTKITVSGTQTENVSGKVSETYGQQLTNGGADVTINAGTIHLN